MKKKRYKVDLLILLIGWIGVFLAFGVFKHIPDNLNSQTKTADAKVKKVHKHKRSKKKLSKRQKIYGTVYAGRGWGSRRTWDEISL